MKVKLKFIPLVFVSLLIVNGCSSTGGSIPTGSTSQTTGWDYNDPDNGGFEVKTSIKSYLTRTILLTIGRRGTPRKLDVDGESLPKVVYRLTDPEQYLGMSVLVVGGGDSAIEAACSIAELADTDVSLSYRKDNFSRAKAKNRKRLEKLELSGQLRILYSSSVKRITDDKVTIIQDQKETTLDNQAVIICAGGILPTGLLQAMGVTVATKYREE